MVIAADLDPAAIIPPGATLAWGEGAAEPRTLTAALSAQHERLRGRRVLLGITPGDLGVLAAAGGLEFISYGGRGAGAALQRPGRLQIMPCHMSALVRMIVITAFETFVALNSALEVDLTGQVDAEVIEGVHVGAVGGLADFSRAATASPRGRSVIAVRSTARHGTVSRIVPRLTSGVATLARSDVDTVVTEYGAADLRTGTLTQRAQRLAAIAHPKFRAELLQALPS